MEVAYFRVFLALATGARRVGEVEYWALLSFCDLHCSAFSWHTFDRAVQNDLKCKRVLKVKFCASHWL
jgi:hypothetical protein